MVVAEPLLAAPHLLELFGDVTVLRDERLVRVRDLLDRPQGLREQPRVSHATDLEVVGCREREMVGDLEALRLVTNRLVPRVRRHVDPALQRGTAERDEAIAKD